MNLRVWVHNVPVRDIPRARTCIGFCRLKGGFIGGWSAAGKGAFAAILVYRKFIIREKILCEIRNDVDDVDYQESYTMEGVPGLRLAVVVDLNKRKQQSTNKSLYTRLPLYQIVSATVVIIASSKTAEIGSLICFQSTY